MKEVVDGVFQIVPGEGAIYIALLYLLPHIKWEKTTGRFDIKRENLSAHT